MNFEVPHWGLCIFWLIWVGQSLWCMRNAYMFRRFMRGQGKREDGKQIVYEPSAAIIIPVKGADDRLLRNIHGVRSQAYPKYRVVFVVQSETDPAHAAIQAAMAEDGDESVPVELLVAGSAEVGGQKVHNLLRGLDAVRDDDEVVVFADADAVPDDQWLRRLITPLLKERVGVTTGYRWLIPEDDALASKVGSVINASVATLMGPDRYNHAWGGSMAIQRKTLEACNLREHWQGALSDDYQMTRAIKVLKLRVYFVGRCLVASPVRFTWGSLFEFGVRQYRITRVYSPGIWLIALFAMSLSVGGWLISAGALAMGIGWALPAMMLVSFFDTCRAKLRRSVVGEIFGRKVVDKLRGTLDFEKYSTTFWMMIHLLFILISSVGSKLTWSRITYHMPSRQGVKVISRG